MSNIAIGSSFRNQPNSVATAHLPKEARDFGVFKRTGEDGVGRPRRGPMQTTGLPPQQQVAPGALAEANRALSIGYEMATMFSGARRNEVSLTFANGDTATITGDARTQNVRIRTQAGLVREATIGVNGARPFAVSGRRENCSTNWRGLRMRTDGQTSVLCRIGELNANRAKRHERGKMATLQALGTWVAARSPTLCPHPKAPPPP